MFPTGLANKLQFQSFLMQSGNQLRLSYYTSVEVNNPSGNKNIKYIDYISINRSPEDYSYVQRLELIYDIGDDIIQVLNLPS